MLGDKIGEETGRVTSRRILPGGDFRYVKMEITFESEGTIYGVQGQNIGTYEIFERIEGQLYGEGQGIVMTRDGQGAIWKGHGIGQMTETGGVHFAFSVAFQTNGASLMKLNNVLVIGEHQAEADGSAHSTYYEWKP